MEGEGWGEGVGVWAEVWVFSVFVLSPSSLFWDICIIFSQVLLFSPSTHTVQSSRCSWKVISS